MGIFRRGNRGVLEMKKSKPIIGRNTKRLRAIEIKINEYLPLRSSGRWTLEQFIIAGIMAGVFKGIK